ncbi:Cell division protein FtsI [Peptidoglycan synthetase] [Helicobacter bizzozeronii CCUG 35545]|nr:Cell division protein FtsI [Peptidoglycan synthetase] [Helicobacter bizzozeronii CCUG 35545]
MKTRAKKVVPKIGLSIEVSGIARNYLYADNFEPLVGYVKKNRCF